MGYFEIVLYIRNGDTKVQGYFRILNSIGQKLDFNFTV